MVIEWVSFTNPSLLSHHHTWHQLIGPPWLCVCIQPGGVQRQRHSFISALHPQPGASSLTMLCTNHQWIPPHGARHHHWTCRGFTPSKAESPSGLTWSSILRVLKGATAGTDVSWPAILGLLYTTRVGWRNTFQTWAHCLWPAILGLLHTTRVGWRNTFQTWSHCLLLLIIFNIA